MEKRIEEQLKIFRKGISAYVLSTEATTDFGIRIFNDTEQKEYEHIYTSSNIEVEKFVPASGAATRMFKDLQEFKNTGKPNKSSRKFFESYTEFPFGLIGSEQNEMLKELFELRKLDQLPKGLLPFHKYSEEHRTATEEHMAEGMEYVEKGGRIKIHFTVSPEHLEEFQKHVETSPIDSLGNFNITFSTQNPDTNTVAVDLRNEPVRSENNDLQLRPAGHGALLENLNQRKADIVFIKNIDNVVPDSLKGETIKFKKILAGVLIDYQAKTFDLLERNEKGEDIFEAGRNLLEELGLKGDFSYEEIVKKLNRPIRVCGMVKNLGEPGGGPFWVKEKRGTKSLQIVESAQIDKENADQEEIFKKSTHFNPVDLVCGIKDFRGEKFDLLKFRDPNTGFISEKSYKGKPIKALELPGLWNGSMADWNTVFVEVPLSTFNPVKTINDLLKPEHQA